MEKRRNLIANLAILGALVAFAAIFCFSLRINDDAYMPLIFAAITLVAVDAMSLFVGNELIAGFWVIVFAISVTVIVESMFDVRTILVIASGALTMLVIKKLSSKFDDGLVSFLGNTQIWGMLIYAIFIAHNDFWKFPIAIGIGVIATIPSILINCICDNLSNKTTS